MGFLRIRRGVSGSGEGRELSIVEAFAKQAGEEVLASAEEASLDVGYVNIIISLTM